MPINPVEIAVNLIKCESVTPNEGGALKYLSRLLADNGFNCKEYIFEGDGSYPVHNLYAKFGNEEPNFCFGGHTDVVPIGDGKAWSFPPFGAVIEGEYLYGRGAEDMKGAVAAFTAAAINLIQKNPDLKGSVSLLLTGDEEADSINGTVKTLKALSSEGEKFSACLVGEPTNPNILGEMVKIGRRGSITSKIKVFGVQGHVAYPYLAENPITKLLQFLSELKSRILDSGNEFFQPSNLEITNIEVNNNADNVIPAHASATINIRFNNNHTSDSLKEWVEKVVKKYCDKYELSHRVSGESFLTEKGSLSDITAKAVFEITGITPEFSTTGGTSDARFFKNYCPVVEFGTTGSTAHKVNERVKIDDIIKLEKVYTRILEYFFKLKSAA